MPIRKTVDARLKSTQNAEEVGIAVIDALLHQPQTSSQSAQTVIAEAIRKCTTRTPLAHSLPGLTVQNAYSRLPSRLLDSTRTPLEAPPRTQETKRLISEFIQARDTYHGDVETLSAMIDGQRIIDALSAPLRPLVRDDVPMVADWMTVTLEELRIKTAPSLHQPLRKRIDSLSPGVGMLFTCGACSISVTQIPNPQSYTSSRFCCFDPSTGIVWECDDKDEVAQILSQYFTGISDRIDTTTFRRPPVQYYSQPTQPPLVSVMPASYTLSALPASYTVKRSAPNDNPSFFLKFLAILSGISTAALGLAFIIAGLSIPVTPATAPLVAMGSALLASGIFATSYANSSRRSTEVTRPCPVEATAPPFSAAYSY